MELKCKLDNRINRDRKQNGQEKIENNKIKKLHCAPICHSYTSGWERAMHFGSRMSKAYKKKRGAVQFLNDPKATSASQLRQTRSYQVPLQDCALSRRHQSRSSGRAEARRLPRQARGLRSCNGLVAR